MKNTRRSIFGLSSRELALIGFALVSMLIWRSSWIAEDGFFDLRIIKHLLAGQGLTWNIGERVLVVTSPLNLLVTALFVGITREYYWTTLFSEYIAMALFLWGWWRLCRGNGVVYLFSTVALISTLAIRDFSLCGFENPWAYAIIAWLLVCYVNRFRIYWTTTLCSLLILTRFDYALLVVPFLTAFLLRTKREWSLIYFLKIVLGFLPLIVWLVFSFIYYGFLLPNTYYSKCSVLIPVCDKLRQGIVYYISHTIIDPSLVFLLTASLIILITSKKLRWLTLGALLYLGYLLIIGGDYMFGRWLAPILVLLIGLLVIIRPRNMRLLAIISSCATLIPLIAPQWTTNIDWNTGMSDEHSFWKMYQGTMQAKRDVTDYKTRYFVPAIQPTDHYFEPAGYLGFMASDQFYISILSDPCLVRTPSRMPEDWRPGHMSRPMPANYIQAALLGKGDNLDKNLNGYYSAIWQITREPVLSKHRLTVLWDFTLGHYDHFLDDYCKPAEISAEKLEAYNTPVGDVWNKYIVFSQYGIDIKFKEQSKHKFKLWLDHNDSYHCFWYKNGKLVYRSISLPHLLPNGGMSDRHFSCPVDCDTLRLLPDYLDQYSVGQLKLD